MNDFELPIVTVENSQKRILSMDEYLKFVQFHLENTFDQEAYSNWKKMRIVDVPFKIA